MNISDIEKKRASMSREERSVFQNTIANAMAGHPSRRLNDALLYVWVASQKYHTNPAVAITPKTALQMQAGNHSAAADGHTLIAAMKAPVPQEAFDALARLLLAAGMGIPYSKQNEGTP